jgi:hypothetical protein
LSIGARAERVTDSAKQEKVTKLMFKKFPQISQYEQSEEEFGTLVLFRLEPIVILNRPDFPGGSIL